ncbi:hypothetical protein LMG28614_03473 [Paraburkholderia ultramafica]|uniref:Uncharacterized protein n=1 Tax=Paraburkholderia ultramafica TaxID=1544867 RepID=A0A6S7B8Z7_9BURK|nr:hypothetical protein LMG28614_03473 [Paraburkholderia ultramafica]
MYDEGRAELHLSDRNAILFCRASGDDSFNPIGLVRS